MLEHKCEVGDKLWRKRLKADGKTVCNKHYKQFKKYGYFTDNSPRTQRDKNNITIMNDCAYIDLYDKKYNVIAQAIIDIDDVPNIQNLKWHVNNNGYVVNSNNVSIFLHRRILHTDKMVDHINGNRLDNRKSNLRIYNYSTNQMNVNYKGVYPYKNGRYLSKIKIHGKQIHIGIFNIYEEALYARWYAEKLLFKELAYNKEKPCIIESREEEIQKLVKDKVQRL